MAVRMGRDARYLIKRSHEGRRPGAGSGVEWRQIHIAQRPLRDLGNVVVAPPFGGAVRGEVLRRCSDCIWRSEIGSLKATYARGGELRTEIRIFTRAFDDASPAGVARDVDHRGKSPVNTHCRGFARGYPRSALSS